MEISVLLPSVALLPVVLELSIGWPGTRSRLTLGACVLASRALLPNEGAEEVRNDSKKGKKENGGRRRKTSPSMYLYPYASLLYTQRVIESTLALSRLPGVLRIRLPAVASI